MAKDIKFNIDARDELKKGVDELANAVKVTLGGNPQQRQSEILITGCSYSLILYF